MKRAVVIKRLAMAIFSVVFSMTIIVLSAPVAHAEELSGRLSTRSNSVNFSSIALDGIEARASDGGSPLLGDECSVSLSASGNTGSLKYKFVWEQGDWSKWGTIARPSSDPSCRWTPEVSGDVNIWVDATDSAGRVTTRKFPVHVDGCRLSAEGGDRIDWTTGMTVNLRAVSAKGAFVKFVWEKDDWSQWGVAKDASAETSCSWSPKSSGSYRIYADVSVGGLRATETMDVALTEDFSLDGIEARASDGGSPLLGDECSVSLSASGNTGSLKYKFVWEQGDWSKWGTIARPSSDPSCRWTPEVSGDVNIWVDATDSAGRVTTRKFPVHVDRNLSHFDSISVIKDDNSVISAGDYVSITPNLSIRNNSNISYKYVWMKNNWNYWGVLGSGKDLSSFKWNVNHTGDISIYIDVIDNNSGQVITSHVDCYFLPESWTYESINASDRLVKPGTNISLSVDCSGDCRYLNYRFVWSKNNWSEWGIAQQGDSPHLNWVPQTPGDYEVYCDVSGSDGHVITQHVSIGVWKYSKVTAISTDGNNSWGIRADMGALAVERSGKFNFKFVWAKEGWSQWGVLNGPSAVNDAYFNPSDMGLSAGYYYFYCDVQYPDGSIETKSTNVYYNSFGSSTVLGVSRISLVTWLTSHQFDSYYLGTRYSSGFSYDTCLYPNGNPRWDGFTGMNCTGFVAHAYAAVGGDLNPIAMNNNHTPWAGGPGGGGYINAWRWYGYARDFGCKMYEFRTVQDMLNSGYAQKGDIIFFKTNGSIDCHIGFFWGDTPYENKMWHQILPGNLIGPCFNNANKSEYNQSVVLIK